MAYGSPGGEKMNRRGQDNRQDGQNRGGRVVGWGGCHNLRGISFIFYQAKGWRYVPKYCRDTFATSTSVRKVVLR